VLVVKELKINVWPVHKMPAGGTMVAVGACEKPREALIDRTINTSLFNTS